MKHAKDRKKLESKKRWPRWVNHVMTGFILVPLAAHPAFVPSR